MWGGGGGASIALQHGQALARSKVLPWRPERLEAPRKASLGRVGGGRSPSPLPLPVAIWYMTGVQKALGLAKFSVDSAGT